MMNDDQLAHLAALGALNKMMRGDHFSICTLDAAIKSLGTVPDGKAYDILRSLHCVSWRDMEPDLRAAVPRLIERCLNVPAHQFQITTLTPEQTARLHSNTLRLLTRGG